MSYIFDALQRREAEHSQTNSSDLPLATDLLRALESTAKLSKPDLEAPSERPAILDLTPQSGFSEEFESVPMSITPNSRLVCLSDTNCLAAEKFRFLGVRLRQLQQTRPLKKVLITSTIPEEGKSTVAANLAYTLARRRQQKTLLLDGDLRRPALAKQFGLGSVPGLSEWLQDPSSPIRNIYCLEATGLWFLPAGNAPQNSLELLQSAALSPLLKQLSSWFDWIVIDSPPVLPLADTSVWIRSADGVLLVSREGKTEKQQLKRGLESIDKSKLLGAVINGSTHVVQSNYYYLYGAKPISSPKPAAATIPPAER